MTFGADPLQQDSVSGLPKSIRCICYFHLQPILLQPYPDALKERKSSCQKNKKEAQCQSTCIARKKSRMQPNCLRRCNQKSLLPLSKTNAWIHSRQPSPFVLSSYSFFFMALSYPQGLFIL